VGNCVADVATRAPHALQSFRINQPTQIEETLDLGPLLANMRRGVPGGNMCNVRSKNWYMQLLTQTTKCINELAEKDAFQRNGGKIKLIGIEGDVEWCAATRAEWTTLIEDVDHGVMIGQTLHRPQNQRLPIGDLIEALEWLATSDEERHIVIASCPLHHCRQAIEVTTQYCNVHISFVVDHVKESNER